MIRVTPPFDVYFICGVWFVIFFSSLLFWCRSGKLCFMVAAFPGYSDIFLRPLMSVLSAVPFIWNVGIAGTFYPAFLGWDCSSLSAPRCGEHLVLLVSQHSLQTRTIYETSFCDSHCDVSLFILGCGFGPSELGRSVMVPVARRR